MKRLSAILLLTLALPAVAGDPAHDWWSLRPLDRPAVPAGAGHPVDAFLQATLSEKGLEPSPPADRRTLIRRVHFDLHGLPPTPEVVEAFVNSTDPLAYEKLVDGLLASPRHGERWARHWLDTIHFADTHGFEHDDLRPNAWRYRDYVIASFNRDTPWDRFIREQMAADVYHPEETHLTAALGFLGAGNYDSSAAATAPTQFEYLDRDDLVTQTMAAFASTTANCARCHAHKFDPVPQEDYFALQAVFAGIGKGDITYDEDPAVHRERRRLGELRAAVERLDRTVLLAPGQEGLVASAEKAYGRVLPWVPILPESFVSNEGVGLELLADGTLLAGGPVADKDTYTLTAAVGLGEVTAFRIDLLTHETLPRKGPGRAPNGNVHLSEFEVRVIREGGTMGERLEFLSAVADYNQPGGYDVARAIDGDPKTSWAIDPREGSPHAAVFRLAAPLTLPPGARLNFSLPQLQGGGHLIGRFRLSAVAAAGPLAHVLPEELEQLVAKPVAERTVDERVRLAAHFLRLSTAEALSKLPAPATVWAAGRTAVNERGAVTLSEPRTIRLLQRGDLTRPGAEVPPGSLSVLGGLKARFDLADPKDEAARRAALAAWLSDPANPLTWRSVVNRVWHHHFGTGISDTPSDFGRMGGAPTHPALLDWLAVWFRDDARGSLKALHRLIVTSGAYRQGSAAHRAGLAVDPDNRLLWRMNRPRMDADTFRDSVLAVSGRLDLTMGGPSVALFTSRPGPQTTPVLDYDAVDRNAPGASRRSIYRLVWRAIADPFLDALDFPDLGLLAPVRSSSVSPLQALALFNNGFVLHASEQFALRLERMGGTREERIRTAFALCHQRAPSAAELEQFGVLADEHGLAAACRVLFNSNEFLFID